ncbi:hypothetical protein A2U01_0106720, partial [Trifolium medium]|nr:hypothetical protein [Trifolium medium]
STFEAGGTILLGTLIPVDFLKSSKKLRITSSLSASEITGNPS